MFNVQFNGKTESFEKKVKIKDLTNNDKNIICALVNGRVRELDYDVYYDATISFLTIKDPEAMGVYERGLRFLFVQAAHNLYPTLRFKLTYSVSRAIFAQVVSGKTRMITLEMTKKIEAEMKRLSEQDYPFHRKIVTNTEALQLYKKFNLPDKAAILAYRPEKTVHFYECDGYLNYMYGKMVPSTGYLSEFKLIQYVNGLLIRYPRSEYDGQIPPFHDEPTFRDTLIHSQEWGNLVNLSSASGINSSIKERGEVTLINMCENRHNRMLSILGEEIERKIKDIRLICVAGPSSSGKTTFADRLTVELISRGIDPIRISIDDYYKSREEVPIDEDGNYDFESIDALDIKLFNEHLVDLLHGKSVELPKFSFTENKRKKGIAVKIKQNNPIIIEGIHALNEDMTPAIPKYLKYKIFISPQAQINLDYDNPISLTDIRLIRRFVRDAKYRNTTPEETIAMWPSVRRGEFKWIYKTQEEANFVFDSFLNYELCVMKELAMPSLLKIDKESKYGPDAARLIKLLKYFKPIDTKWIPSNSILKEFIGGSCYREA